jgi:hypothetical protein
VRYIASASICSRRFVLVALAVLVALLFSSLCSDLNKKMVVIAAETVYQ